MNGIGSRVWEEAQLFQIGSEMKNDNNHNSTGPQDEQNENEEIPLWLQGLPEQEVEDTNPIEVEENAVEDWVNELTEEKPADSPPPEVEQTDANEAPIHETAGEESFPDWLNELAEIDPATPAVFDRQDSESTPVEGSHDKQTMDEDKNPQAVEHKQPDPEEYPDESNLTDEDLPTHGGEIEMDTTNQEASTEDPQKPTGEPAEENELTAASEARSPANLSEDEDLPPWLQEMISEPEAPSPEAAFPPEGEIRLDEEQINEPTEPIELSETPSDQETPEVDQTPEEDAHEYDPDQAFEESYADTPVEIEEGANDQESIPEPPPAAWIPEQLNVDDETPSDDSPLPPEPAEVINRETIEQVDEPIPAALEENQFLEEQPEYFEDIPVETPVENEIDFEELPADLAQAKALLWSGEMDQAINLIHSYDEKSKHTALIKTLLLEASNVIEEPNQKFWELLGDTALEEDQPELALNAYTNAIQALLRGQEG